MQKALFLIVCLLAFVATTAQAQDYTILSDSTTGKPGTFLMIQGGQATPFDTVTVNQNIAQKSEDITAIETEIALLERLVLLRRQAAAAKVERNTLFEILKRARLCGTKP